jgi:hypothetical protein
MEIDEIRIYSPRWWYRRTGSDMHLSIMSPFYTESDTRDFIRQLTHLFKTPRFQSCLPKKFLALSGEPLSVISYQERLNLSSINSIGLLSKLNPTKLINYSLKCALLTKTVPITITGRNPPFLQCCQPQGHFDAFTYKSTNLDMKEFDDYWSK